jgi:hypothetical protein
MKFPKKLYVSVEDPGTENEFLNPHLKPEDVSIDDYESVMVAVYERVGMIRVTKKVEYLQKKAM